MHLFELSIVKSKKSLKESNFIVEGGGGGRGPMGLELNVKEYNHKAITNN